jgi:AraC-like DNA-binding protein
VITLERMVGVQGDAPAPARAEVAKPQVPLLAFRTRGTVEDDDEARRAAASDEADRRRCAVTPRASPADLHEAQAGKLEARDGVGVLDAGLLVTMAASRETGPAQATRHAMGVLDALLVTASRMSDAIHGRIESAADALATDGRRACSADIAADLEGLWRDVAAMLTTPSDEGLESSVQAYLAERLHEHARLADLARALGYSPSHVSDHVRRITGERFSALRRRLQLERARAALTRGLPVKQAASEAGFADPAYFSRVFRRAFGISPGRWQRETVAPALSAGPRRPARRDRPS